MIGHITGKILSKKPTKILIDVNGIGYLVNVSLNTFEKLPEENQIVSLHTHLHVKEDALDLYGFINPAEKEMFELLITISGIGPKLSQGILSGVQVHELKEALRAGNTARLVAIPGVGRKTAERLVIELREKVDAITDSAEVLTGAPYILKNDAVIALTTLGYNRKIAEGAVRQVIDSKPDFAIEDVIKEALSLLNK
ncbi:MAG: Holliday junction branch migration protein RuvA [bacterium]